MSADPDTLSCYWLWFRGRLLGPFPAWEVSLMLTKCRSVLVYTPGLGWTSPGKWRPAGGGTAATPGAPPLAARLALWLRHRLFRRILRLHH